MTNTKYNEQLAYYVSMEDDMVRCIDALDVDDPDFDQKYDFYNDELCRYGEYIYQLNESFIYQS